MPNYVAANLKLSGDKEQIGKLISDIGEKLDFNSLYPCPAELLEIVSPVKIGSEEEYQESFTEYKENLKKYGEHSGIKVITKERSGELFYKYGTNSWYNWCCEKWGTKWGIFDVNRNENDFYFLTAWSPASRLILKISEKYPDIQFYHEFAEESGEFVCFEKIQNGSILEENSFDWDSENGIEIRERVGYGPSEED